MTVYTLADRHSYDVNINNQVKCGKYIAVRAPEHPRCWANGYIYMHRVVAEISILNRILRDDEVVHHKDHDGHNNSIENLVVQTWSEHAQMHGAECQPALIDLVCEECGVGFVRHLRQHSSRKGYEHSFCSRSCSGKHSRRLQILRARTGFVS